MRWPQSRGDVCRTASSSLWLGFSPGWNGDEKQWEVKQGWIRRGLLEHVKDG